MSQSDKTETEREEVFNGLPVPGYQPQPLIAVGIVSTHKHYEERLLRHLDKLADRSSIDQRWLAIGRTQIEQGFMAINRAVFRPQRIPLPEDPTPYDPAKPFGAEAPDPAPVA